MVTFTGYILPSGSKTADIDRATNAWRAMANKIINPGEVVIPSIIDTDWYGFIYDNEFMDLSLLLAIRHNINENRHAVLLLMRHVKVVNIDSQKREYAIPSYQIVPRIFRREVKLLQPGMMPEDPNVRFKVLSSEDGWLREDPRRGK